MYSISGIGGAPEPTRPNYSTAFRAERGAAVIGESDLDELRVRFLIG
jgi:hypothetical protein